MDTSKKRRKWGKKRKRAKKKADDKSYREHKSDDEAQKQQAVASLDPEEREQRQAQEQTLYTVRRAEEGCVPESESHNMIDAALYVRMNRSITELFSQIEQRVNDITQLHIQLQERLDHMDESQKAMHEKNRLFDRKANSPI